MKKRTRVALLAATVLALSACSGGGSGSGAESAPGGGCQNEKLVLTQSTTGFLYLPSYVALSAGYYSEAGLDVEVNDLGGGAENVAAVASGSADVALTAYSSIISAKDAGAPVVAIGAIMDEYASNIVIRSSIAQERNVTETSTSEEKIRALEGLKIGITSPGSGTDQLLHYLFNQAGLDAEADAQLLPIGGGPAMISAFREGQIDAFSLSSPTSDLALSTGGTLLFNLSEGEYEPLHPFLYIVAIANSRTLDEKARVLTCFSRAIQRSLQLIKDDPAKAMELAKPSFADIDPELYRSAFERNVAAYPETTVIKPDDAAKVFDFVAAFEGRPAEATVESTINTEIAAGAAAN